MIYLDYNATTPVAPAVFDAMKPFFCDEWANPSSSYSFSQKPTNAIENARQQVADLIGAMPEEIVFTSCATESNQTVLQSVIKNNPQQKIVTSAVEHNSVLEPLRSHSNTHILSVNQNGFIDIGELENICCKEQVSLVSIIWANNETGVLSDMRSISEICQKYEILLHTDAVQAAGKLDVDVNKMPVDYLSLSGHKMYGPKGVGALYIRADSPHTPLLTGTQENARRGGTESVPLIVGFGMAAELATKELTKRMQHTRKMRDMLEQHIEKQIPNTYVNGDKEHRLPNTTNIGFRGMDSEMLIQLLGNQGIMVSSGSACKSSAITPSHVLLAMGKSHDEAGEAIRFSLSHLTQEADIHSTILTLSNLIQSIAAV